MQKMSGLRCNGGMLLRPPAYLLRLFCLATQNRNDRPTCRHERKLRLFPWTASETSHGGYSSITAFITTAAAAVPENRVLLQTHKQTTGTQIFHPVIKIGRGA